MADTRRDAGRACSRAKSRLAASALSEHLWPVAKHQGINASADLDAACPLHPRAGNMFRDHENAKTRVSKNNWKCAFCGKAFSSEAFLDAHLDRRHFDRLVADASCIADHCDELHCAEHEHELAKQSKLHGQPVFPTAARPRGTSSATTPYAPAFGTSACAAAERRHQKCEQIAKLCFGRGGETWQMLHAFFLQQFCAPHACIGSSSRRVAPPPKPFALPVPRDATPASRAAQVLFSLFAVAVVVGLAWYYYVMLGHVAATSRGRGDLRRVRDAKRPSVMAAFGPLLGKREKVY